MLRACIKLRSVVNPLPLGYSGFWNTLEYGTNPNIINFRSRSDVNVGIDETHAFVSHVHSQLDDEISQNDTVFTFGSPINVSNGINQSP